MMYVVLCDGCDICGACIVILVWMNCDIRGGFVDELLYLSWICVAVIYVCTIAEIVVENFVNFTFF
jgi:hypothetical protein